MVDVVALGVAMVLICIAMYVIAFACDSFEPAADYLGTEVYKLAPGVRGASIEAVASSLPELFTTMVLLFVYNDVDGFSAGIATCAGSALFNGAVIPAICILCVTDAPLSAVPIARPPASLAAGCLRGGCRLATRCPLPAAAPLLDPTGRSC